MIGESEDFNTEEDYESIQTIMKPGMGRPNKVNTTTSKAKTYRY